MEAVKRLRRNTEEIMPCPFCGGVKSVGLVLSMEHRLYKGREQPATCWKYYCRNCLIEFDGSGEVTPPFF